MSFLLFFYLRTSKGIQCYPDGRGYFFAYSGGEALGEFVGPHVEGFVVVPEAGVVADGAQ